jgi:hypothetical protein
MTAALKKFMRHPFGQRNQLVIIYLYIRQFAGFVTGLQGLLLLIVL